MYIYKSEIYVHILMVYCYRRQTPAEADFNLLDTARKVELYGIRMHPTKVNSSTNSCIDDVLLQRSDAGGRRF